MAVTVGLYNHTVHRFVDSTTAGAFNDGQVYKINLFSAFTPDVADVHLSGAVSGQTQLTTQYGYTQNSKTVSGTAITITGNDAKFDASDVTWTAAGGAIGPASHALIYNDSVTDKPPVLYIAFGENKTADDGTDFKITWAPSGIIRFTYT